MSELLVSNPFVTALIFILFVAVAKISYAYSAANENISRFWRAVGGTGCSTVTLIMVLHVLLNYTGLTLILGLLVSASVHLYINWTIGLWRDRRDRRYPYVLRMFRNGRGLHFYWLMDVFSHGTIVAWVHYTVGGATSLF